MPLRPNSLKHRFQIVAQVDDSVEGHVLMPLGAQPRNHFWKPDSLAFPGGHAWTVVTCYTLANASSSGHGDVPGQLPESPLSWHDPYLPRWKWLMVSLRASVRLVQSDSNS